MTFNLQSAQQFIQSANLPPRPQAPREMGEDDTFDPFETVKDQATVVGADILAFMSGTEKEFREAISNSSLLAQLVADREVADSKDIYSWYESYFRTLRNIGWVVQDSGFEEYYETGEGFEVHERIVDVATVLLGPAPAALAVVKTTLSALKGMDEDSPWIKLFSRESTRVEAARFQISLIQPEDADSLLVTMIAFGIEAEKMVTQVLFFKVKKNKARLKSNSAKVSINVDAMRDLAPLIEEKIRAYQKEFILNLPSL